jgi:hypothetical protein
MKLSPLSLCALLALAGCAGSAPASEQSAESSPPAATTENSSVDSSAAPSAANSSADPLDASFAEMTGSIVGDVGIAIASESGVRPFGSWTVGPAWSTIKVPLAIAALRHSAQEASPYVPLAIRDSDNTAADKLWSQLGQPQDAAEAVGAILKETGDTTTIVESARKRPDFSVFGQTEWSVVNQASFMAALPCIPNSESVLTDMKSLAGNQKWGLALRDDASVKGGWGPSPEKAYLVRQVATITTENGHLGIALSASPQDGSFDSGVAQIGKLAQWVGEHLDAFTPKKCSL